MNQWQVSVWQLLTHHYMRVHFYKLMALQTFVTLLLSLFISHRALAREGDYEMMPVCAGVRVLVRHADFSKTTTATDFF